MPLLAALFAPLVRGIYEAFLAFSRFGLATKAAAVTAVGGAYTACAALFTVTVAPFWAGALATQYGFLFGLLFPPLAGTVLAALIILWSCVLAKKFMTRLLKIMV